MKLNDFFTQLQRVFEAEMHAGFVVWGPLFFEARSIHILIPNTSHIVTLIYIPQLCRENECRKALYFMPRQESLGKTVGEDCLSIERHSGSFVLSENQTGEITFFEYQSIVHKISSGQMKEHDLAEWLKSFKIKSFFAELLKEFTQQTAHL